MTREELFRTLGEIDERYIDETVNDFNESYTLYYEEENGMSLWKKICLAAACLALVATAATVIFIRSRSHENITPPLSNASTSQNSTPSDSTSGASNPNDITPVFPDPDRVIEAPHPEWLDSFDYETEFFSKPDPNAEVFGGTEKDDSPLCTLNNKERRPNLFCYGGGKAYLSLYNKVYEYDPETNAAVPMFTAPAYDLNYKDGYLYYVLDTDYDLDSRNISSPEGPLFRCNIATGETKQLTAYDVGHLVVSDDGIYFMYTDYVDVEGLNGSGYIHMCRFDEETGECERIGVNNFSYIEYNGFTLGLYYESDENNHYAFEKDGKQYILPGNSRPNWDSICGDYYYFVAEIGHSLNRLNMLTGEIDLTIFDEIDYDGTKRLVCQDYTVFNNEIYYIDRETTLCRYDEETGSPVQYCSVAADGVDRTLAPRYLYTGGDSIYVLVGNTAGHGGYDGQCEFLRLTYNGTNMKVEQITL